MRLSIKITTIFFLLFHGLLAQSIDYKQVSVNISDSSVIPELLQNDIDLDHSEFDKTGTLTFIVSEEDELRLQSSGIQYNVIVEDMRVYYQQMISADAENFPNPQRSAEVADSFDLGSMGGFYTLAEVEAKLDEMFVNYPNIITPKTSIGTSIEGRDIWMVKISDNPNQDEAEPVAYFDALHHAREPLAMAATVNYMFWLLENYGTDPSVTYLIDNRELYFVPVVNPDGYFFNETTDPEGGGLWRKNMRPDPGGCIGVDLNRNYGFGYANNNDCSSTDPCSNIYRGTSAFSEPESIAVADLMSVIQPSTAFSTHSTAGSYLMPYGFDTTPPDFEIYSEWASAFLSENDYPYGVTFQMLGYTSCGTTRDYLHSEGIYAWTPEIDGQGFWPPPSTIFDLVGENVYPMFYQSWIAGGYAELQSYDLIGQALNGTDFELNVELKNVGVGGAAKAVSVEITSDNPEILISPAIDYGNIPARERINNSSQPFNISIPADFEGTSFELTVSCYQGNALNGQYTIPVEVGESSVIFSDDAEGGSANWLSYGNGLNWGLVTDDSFSGNGCFGDSDGGNGENNTENFFELDREFDLTTTESPLVRFNTKYAIESDDLVSFEISTDEGLTWQQLTTYSDNSDWMTEIIYLQGYTSETSVRFRFSMVTDNFIPADGFYFDDFQIIDYDRQLLNNAETVVDSEIMVYPNPFSNDVMIKLPNNLTGEAKSIEVYDISGRTIDRLELDYNDSQQVVMRPNVRTGLYLMRILDASGSSLKVIKLIKK